MIVHHRSGVLPEQALFDALRDFFTAQRFKQLWSRYQQSRDLISVGAYVPGGDADTDMAIARQPLMARYLRQGLLESEGLAESAVFLAQVLNPAAPAG